MVGRVGTRLLVCAGLAGVCALSLAASASALTLGSLAPPHFGGCTSCDAFQFQVAAGEPKYRVPAGPSGFWKITSWVTQGGGTAAGQARLRVYRQTGAPGQFKLVRESQLRTVPANGHPQFATDLNVQKGDLLGLGTIENVPAGYQTGVMGDNMKNLHCDVTGPGLLVGQGTSCPLSDLPNSLVNVVATMHPR